MTYFVACFVCRSEQSDCGHREPELVTWWKQQRRTMDGMDKIARTEAETAPEPFDPAPWQRGYQKRLQFGAVADSDRIQ